MCAGFCGCEPPDSRAQLWAFLVVEGVLGLFQGARLGNSNTYSRVFPGPRVIRQGLWVGQMLPTLARVFSALLVASYAWHIKQARGSCCSTCPHSSEK